MLKIFLTGDNHIGLKYASHEKSSVIISKRTGAFFDMVSAANKEGCGLFVIAGDLFENTRGVPKKDIAALLGTLSDFAGTVVILPGNHDYYDKDVRVWQCVREIIADYDNIMLLTEHRPYEITVGEDDVIIYPALCNSLHSQAGQNNLGWIKNETIGHDGKYHIGIAHGAVEGETIDSEGQYFLMKRSELESIPVDVWLIGHTHVPFPANLTESYEKRSDKIFNAGTHVQTDVNCNTDGECFVIEIDSDKIVRAKKYVSGNLRFYRKKITLSAEKMQSIIDRELEDISDESIVDLILCGAVTADEYADRAETVGKALSRFIEGTYSDCDLSRIISKELIDAEFPETSFSAKLLTALIDEPKEAQLAYELLKSIKEGK